jgi:pantoate--beta-alanine ligase
MEIIRTLNQTKKIKHDKKIGLVPTMGYLHEGHMSLVRKAREECDLVVVSIYVNPTQFGPGEDLDAYPRDMDHDKKLCEDAGVDYIFAPTDNEMYPEGYQTTVSVNRLTKMLCGKSRPTHFDGVTTVVSKLFNIIRPNVAYFGQKDYQQTLVIKQMVKDLNMGVDISVEPIVREQDGLAMSSRNKYLSPKQRKDALVLHESLDMAKDFVKKNDDLLLLKKAITDKIKIKNGEIDYVEVLHKDDLTPLDIFEEGKTLIALAVRFGNARLIDNKVL